MLYSQLSRAKQVEVDVLRTALLRVKDQEDKRPSIIIMWHIYDVFGDEDMQEKMVELGDELGCSYPD